jgi:hypothetical protein
MIHGAKRRSPVFGLIVNRISMPWAFAKSKEKRKILIYGINYAPEMIGVGRFTGEIGAYLAQNGFDVCVVTAPPSWRMCISSLPETAPKNRGIIYLTPSHFRSIFWAESER